MKILIITYYWPPSGGAGVQRWLKFCKYLPGYQIKPTVLTTKQGDYPVWDYSLLDDVDESLQVVRTTTPTFRNWFGSEKTAPYGSLAQQQTNTFWQNLAIWLRLNFIVPDARKIWNRKATASARELLSKEKFDAIITTGPPHSTHLIGLKLKKEFQLRWLADFRDPWCEIDYLKNVKRFALTAWFDRYLQNKVVSTCDDVISINRAIVNSLQAEEKSEIISNGYDPEDFSAEIEKKDNFTIAYFGILTPERPVDVVIEALNKLYQTGIKNIDLDFYGKVEAKSRLQALAKYDFINFHEYIPHQQATAKMQQADILLLVINDVANNQGIITGKIFEYIGSRTAILALGPAHGEAAKILAETEAGQIYDYTDSESVLAYISKIYQLGTPFEPQPEKYSRQVLSGKLAELLQR
jgi:glycosyltransferase involved in cell wall biosynthesis